MTSKKSISVIIPCYNYAQYLEEAVLSVINQTIKPIEIVIADDCSQDNTENISKNILEKYSNENIIYYRNKINLGIVKNFNKAVKNSRGDYICFLGADNRFKKTYLEKTSNVLDKYSKVAISYTDFELFGPRASEIYKDFNPKYQGKVNIQKQKYIINFPNFNSKTREIQKTQNFIHGSSMYKRKAFFEVGGYKQDNLIAEDQNLFSRILLNGWYAKRVPEALLEYRQHSEEQANIKLQNKNLIENLKEENIKLKNELNVIKSSKTYRYWQKFNDVKKYFFSLNIKKLFIDIIYFSSNFHIHRLGVLLLSVNQQRKLGFNNFYKNTKPIVSIFVNKNIPSLSWICNIVGNKYNFIIGKNVEYGKNFIFEGVWDGNFKNIDINKSEFVYGSGSVFDKKVDFIPPKHIFESLYVLVNKKNKTTFVSNSLAYIVKIGISKKFKFLDEISGKINDYINISSELGIDRYNPKFYEDQHYILYRMIYYNFTVNNTGNINVRSNLPKKYFNNFTEYRKFLHSKINQVFENSTSKYRINRYDPITTLSKGYDSPTISILAKENGCTEALTLNTKIYNENDSGYQIAEILKLKIYSYKHIFEKFFNKNNINTLDVNINPKNEKYFFEFIATGGLGDDITYLPFQNKLKNRVLLTGSFGDSVWEKNTSVKPGISCNIPYMKSITEFRLRNNFVFFPVPTLASRFPQIIKNISNSVEMEKYSNLSSYDRPICRRIIESAKIPSNLFGIKKSAIAPNVIDHQKYFKKSINLVMSRYSK